MAKAHWTSRYDITALTNQRQSLAERAKGMLQRSGLMNDVSVAGERSIKVGMPEGFDDTTDPMGVARRVFREDKISAVARVLRLRYVIEFQASDDDSYIFVNFLS
jgi:hypothetical protein